MKCPHCKIDFHNVPVHIILGEDADGGWKIETLKCTSCRKFIIYLKNGNITDYIEEQANTRVYSRGARNAPEYYKYAPYEEPENKEPGNGEVVSLPFDINPRPKIRVKLPEKLFNVNEYPSKQDNVNEYPSKQDIEDADVKQILLVRPKAILRSRCPEEVPAHIAEDYNEACLVLAESPKASAALSRRCLQNLLRDVAKVKPDDLAKEIQQVLDSGSLPTYIADTIDSIRNIGNFAAHPMKSQQSGEVLPVEPEEAEWNLDVLEALFDFYCVQPTILQKKKDALNRKLQEAGKKPMK